MDTGLSACVSVLGGEGWIPVSTPGALRAPLGGCILACVPGVSVRAVSGRVCESTRWECGKKCVGGVCVRLGGVHRHIGVTVSVSV